MKLPRTMNFTNTDLYLKKKLAKNSYSDELDPVKEKIVFIYALVIFWPRILHSSAENFVDNQFSKETFWPKFCQMFVDKILDVRLVSLGLSISYQRCRSLSRF